MTLSRTPKGTKHEPTIRLSLSGKKVSGPRPADWHTLAARIPQPPKGAHHDPEHPSRKHDVFRSA